MEITVEGVAVGFVEDDVGNAICKVIDAYKEEIAELEDARKMDRLVHEAEKQRLKEALEIIAGRRQCLDNLMSNADIALAALQEKE